MLVAPGAGGGDEIHQAASQLCQLALDVWRIRFVVVADQKSVALHVPQGLGEHLQGDRGQLST